MRSLGIFYSLKSDNQPIERWKERQYKRVGVSEIHINLWKLAQKRKRRYFSALKYSYFFDLGIKFDASIKSLIVYLPFSVTKEDITDLGDVLTKNNEVAGLVFNEQTTTIQQTPDCFQYIDIDVNRTRLAVYPLGSTNYSTEETEETNKGTYLKIEIKSSPQNEGQRVQPIYVRFRIRLNELSLSQICHDEHISNDIIQAVSSRMQIYDIRLNDKREIDRKIIEDLQNKSYKLFRFSKVHYFFMSDTTNDLKSSSPTINDRRFLETIKWQPYLNAVTPQNLVAFHWKDKKKDPVGEGAEYKDDSFPCSKVFFSVTYPKHTLLQYTLYALIAISISVLGVVLTSLTSIFSLSPDSNKWPFLPLVVLIILLLVTLVVYHIVSNNNRLKYTDENPVR
jgi:hypothetical protein